MNVPQIGTLLRPVGSDIAYRVTSAGKSYVYVEATSDEAPTLPGRQPRKLAYDEKRHMVSLTSDGKMIDGKWRAWEPVRGGSAGGGTSGS